MRPETYNCKESRLEVLLRGDESSGEYRQAYGHVENCLACQRRLAAMAGDGAAWREVREILTETAAHDDSTEIEAWIVGDREESDRKSALAAITIKSLAPATHPELLGRLGRYDIERIIGSGGMGVVLKGFDGELNRPVAIKVLAPHLANVGAARRRFAREARAAAAVVHEHVVAIHNVESESSLPFLVMQFVPGESLQVRLDREGPLELREVLRIGMQTAAGLAAAHAQGLVHRDIKPANILLEDGVDRVTITDFGLARTVSDASVTCTGNIAGTPQYMSPEQARGEPVDNRSDLFSLGSVLYAMCTGRAPFRAESPYGVLKKICDDVPMPVAELNPDVPVWLEKVIQRLMAKSAADRIHTATELHQLLAGCLAHVEQPSKVPLPEAAKVRAVRRWKLPALAGAALVGATIIGAAALAWVWPPPAGQPIQNEWPPPPAATSASSNAAAATTATATTATTEPQPITEPQPTLRGEEQLESEIRSVANGIERLEHSADNFWDW